MPDARFAGVPVPSTKPSFRTERFPLWEPNVASDSPVRADTDSAGNPLRHFSTNGNAYWKQEVSGGDATAMSWDKEDYFGIKLYIRPRSVDGRIQVFRRGPAGRGGPFLEIVDGKGRFGWYDTDLKKDVWVETSGQVFWPGRIHYVYIRKRWPQHNADGGNWEDSYWSNNQIRRITVAAAIVVAVGSTVTDGTRTGRVIRRINNPTTIFDVYTTTNDVAWAGAIGGQAITAVAVPSSDLFIVKRFAAPSDTSRDRTGFEAYVDATSSADTINCVSFTSAEAARSAGVNAVGVVTPLGALFTGLIGGVVVSADMDPGAGVERYPPRLEMSNMYFTWGTAAGVAFAGKNYRMGTPSLGGTPQFTVTQAYDLSNLPNFAAIVAATEGQASTGIELIKSDDFDNSYSPDSTGSTTIYFMGSEDQGKATSTYQPFDGEVWCPGWMIDAPASAGVDARLFQDASAVTFDPVTIGADYFEESPYGANTAALTHQLQYTASYVRFAWDGRPYGGADVVASTQPTKLDPNANDTVGPKIVRASASPAITGQTIPFWEYVQGRSLWAEQRYVAIGFRDPVQGITGRPGPTARIKALIDDRINPSGVVRVVVSDIPTGPPGVEVVIWESAAGGDASVLFEAARVPNGTSEYAIQTLESLITLNQAADFDAYEPPRCSLVATGQSRLVYGALETQPDGMTPSRVGQPGLADFGKSFRLAGGTGDRITAMADLDGLLAVFKRRAMGSVSFNSAGFAIVQLVSTGVGCVSNQTLQSKDSMLWFLSDRGVQISDRDGITNLGRPQYVGEKVERFFEQVVDLRRLPRASAAINRSRNQYVVAMRTADETMTNARISAQLRGDDVVFSRYRGPNVTALATVQSREPGADLVVAGTEEGFMVWMDRTDTALLMMGPDPAIWGVFQVQSFGGSGSSTLALNVQTIGALDPELTGPLGVVARFNDAGGVEREVPILGAEGPIMHFAQPLLAAIPTGTQIEMGAQIIHWETAWLDMGNPETMKSLIHLDLVLETRDTTPTGVIYCAIYRDWDLDDAPFTKTLDLGQVPYRLTPTSLRGRWFKLVIEHAPNTSNVKFDVAALVWRVRDEDQN